MGLLQDESLFEVRDRYLVQLCLGSAWDPSLIMDDFTHKTQYPTNDLEYNIIINIIESISTYSLYLWDAEHLKNYFSLIFNVPIDVKNSRGTDSYTVYRSEFNSSLLTVKLIKR